MGGQCLALGHSLPSPLPSPPPISSTGTKRAGLVLRARPSAVPSRDSAEPSDLFPPSALDAAALRHEETNHPGTRTFLFSLKKRKTKTIPLHRFVPTTQADPLFIDPYAGCFLSSTDRVVSAEASRCRSHYSLATRFIDDKVGGLLRGSDELRQVVLLTDGTDTRPYRLQWPRSSLIFDVSPGMVFKEASKRLEGIGARIAKTCFLLHVPFETSDIQGVLCQTGFNGTRPSIWVLQGLPMTSLADFRKILSVVGSLAMKGCIFVGELPCQLMDAEVCNTISVQRWFDKIFLSSGFRVDVMDYAAIAKDLHCDPPFGLYDKVLFFARQLQLSDGQMENWWMELRRLEEEGDEEGFVDMLF